MRKSVLLCISSPSVGTAIHQLWGETPQARSLLAGAYSKKKGAQYWNELENDRRVCGSINLDAAENTQALLR